MDPPRLGPPQSFCTWPLWASVVASGLIDTQLSLDFLCSLGSCSLPPSVFQFVGITGLPTTEVFLWGRFAVNTLYVILHNTVATQVTFHRRQNHGFKSFNVLQAISGIQISKSRVGSQPLTLCWKLWAAFPGSHPGPLKFYLVWSWGFNWVLEQRDKGHSSMWCNLLLAKQRLCCGENPLGSRTWAEVQGEKRALCGMVGKAKSLQTLLKARSQLADKLTF